MLFQSPLLSRLIGLFQFQAPLLYSCSVCRLASFQFLLQANFSSKLVCLDLEFIFSYMSPQSIVIRPLSQQSNPAKITKKNSAHNLTCQRGDYRARRSAHQRPRHRQRTEPENQHGRYELIIPVPE
jgi:hypothetical protein